MVTRRLHAVSEKSFPHWFAVKTHRITLNRRVNKFSYKLCWHDVFRLFAPTSSEALKKQVTAPVPHGICGPHGRIVIVPKLKKNLEHERVSLAWILDLRSLQHVRERIMRVVVVTARPSPSEECGASGQHAPERATDSVQMTPPSRHVQA